jgi:hypothetical protein
MAQISQPITSTSPIFAHLAQVDKFASTYEDVSTPMKGIATHLLSISSPLNPSSIIHDNASGPGIVTGEILQLPRFTHSTNHPSIHATDISPAMIRALEARASREFWPPTPSKPTSWTPWT